jgi:hypothetical protein
MSNLSQQLGGTGGIIALVGMAFGFFIGLLGVTTAGPWAVMFYLALWGLIIGIFWHFVFGPMFTANRILKTGEDGIAKIIALVESGASLKSGGSIAKPGVRITLKVKPASGKPEYEATVKTFLSMFEINEYQPGREVKVRIDRNNPQKVAIVGQVGPLQTYSAS